jgi:hypothetical protein
MPLPASIATFGNPAGPFQSPQHPHLSRIHYRRPRRPRPSHL